MYYYKMKYYYITNQKSEIELYYKSIFDNIVSIRENKEDIIYKSAIPRLKQTTARGIQALKQLLKRLDSKIKYDESIKTLWLNCFKLVYNYDCYGLNINGINTIIFNKSIDKDKLEQLIKIDNYILTEEEINKPENKNDIIKIAIDYIKNENLTKDEIIEVFINLLSNN